MDKLDFLDPQGSGNDVVQPEPTPAPEPEPQIEAQPRDEAGRFAPKASDAVAAFEPAPEPTPAPQPSAPPHGYVPIAVVKDLRDEIRQLRQPQPVAAPPEAFIEDDPYAQDIAQWVAAPLEQQLIAQRFHFSQQLAETKYGAETVAQAWDWALQKAHSDPHFERGVLSVVNPFETVIAEFKREQVLSKLSDPSEIDQYLAWKAAQSQLAQQQTAAPVAAPQPAPPPLSIASAPGGGGVQHVPQGPGQAFDSIFRR